MHSPTCRLTCMDRYEKLVSSTSTGIDVPLPVNWTVDDVESWLMVHTTTANSGKAVDPEADLFAQGFDR
jgi:hypothetical protein